MLQKAEGNICYGILFFKNLEAQFSNFNKIKTRLPAFLWGICEDL